MEQYHTSAYVSRDIFFNIEFLQPPAFSSYNDIWGVFCSLGDDVASNFFQYDRKVAYKLYIPPAICVTIFQYVHSAQFASSSIS
jgi:hypothetical protein